MTIVISSIYKKIETTLEKVIKITFKIKSDNIS